MYCRKCGAEIGTSAFCPRCGTPQNTNQPSAGPQPLYQTAGYRQGPYGQVADRFRKLFRDPLYIILTVLMTAQTVLSFWIGSETTYRIGRLSIGSGFDLGSLLFTVALWIILFSASGNSVRFTSGGLTMASVLLKIILIFLWIALIATGVGVLLLLATLVVPQTWIGQLVSSGDLTAFLNEPELSAFQPWISQLSTLGALPFMVVILIIAAVAVLIIVLVLLYYKKLHDLAKSMSLSAKTDVLQLKSAAAARNWLMVFAILNLCINGISLLTGSFALSAIPSVCTSAVSLLAAALIKRHLI